MPGLFPSTLSHFGGSMSEVNEVIFLTKEYFP